MPGIDRSSLTGLVQEKLSLTKPMPLQWEHIITSNEEELGELLKALAEDAKKTVEDLALAMFSGMAASLETAHCLLFMLTRSGEFRVRHGYGKGIDELRSKLRISAEFKPTAFHAVIKNNVDVSIADMARLKPTSLPEGFRELLPAVNKFIILPIANGRVSGLLYCDWDRERTITAAEMAVVRKLRDLYVPFFPKA